MYLKEYRIHAMEAASDRLSVQNRIPEIHKKMYHITCISDIKVRKMTKDQETIQSSTISDPGYHMRK